MSGRGWGGSAALVAVVGVWGCGGGEASESAAEVSSPDPVPAATATEESRRVAVVRAGARLVRELHIGSLDDGPYALSGVWDLAVGPGGHIYAALHRVGEVREYTAEGEYVRTIGRRGQGPEDMYAPQKLAFHPDGSLWVMDLYNRRYSIIDPASGRIVDTRPRVMAADCPIWSTGWFDLRGVRYEGEVSIRGLESGRGTKLECTLHRMSADGTERVASLLMPSAIGRGGPYAPRAPFAFDPETGTVWTGNNHFYRITRLSFDGDTVAVAQADVEQAAVTPEDLVRMSEERNRALGGAGIEGRAAPTKGPDQKPFYSHMAVDGEGLLWVARVTAVDGDADRFDVFTRQGEWVGTVSLDTPVRVASAAGMQNERYPLVFSGGRLYGVHEDELGVPRIMRWRLEPSEEGP